LTFRWSCAGDCLPVLRTKLQLNDPLRVVLYRYRDGVSGIAIGTGKGWGFRFYEVKLLSLSTVKG